MSLARFPPRASKRRYDSIAVVCLGLGVGLGSTTSEPGGVVVAGGVFSDDFVSAVRVAVS